MDHDRHVIARIPIDLEGGEHDLDDVATPAHPMKKAMKGAKLTFKKFADETWKLSQAEMEYCDPPRAATGEAQERAGT